MPVNQCFDHDEQTMIKNESSIITPTKVDKSRVVKVKVENILKVNNTKSVPAKNITWPINRFFRSPNIRSKLKKFAIIILIRKIAYIIGKRLSYSYILEGILV